MKVSHLYQQVISIENLFQAWSEFRIGKRARFDVQFFERNLENNLFELYDELKEKTYKHSTYAAFNIYDPKFRHIHKATVRDRIVHHAIVSVIEPIFDKTFIFDSYSCRKNKGMHKAVKRLDYFIRKVSKNYTNNCFVLKLDIKKFFASVNNQILLECIKKKIDDEDLIWLINNVLKSFSLETGIPIGNLTSQIFANIYLNELDRFIKQSLRIKYYIRYADDFVIVSTNLNDLNHFNREISYFLQNNLKLELHPNKVLLRKYNQGIDFLGYIVLPHYILPRTKTKKRIFRKINGKILALENEKISEESLKQTLASYQGFLKHSTAFRLIDKLENLIVNR